jgi:hypothetical protein
MISWIVASHDPAILSANLRPTLTHPDDELIVIDAPSIGKAYNTGQARATQPIRCYVHHDVQVLDLPALRAELARWCQPWVGMVGVNGSRCRAIPWWTGAAAGSVVDERMGQIGAGKGGEVAYLDGLLLATIQHIEWDETYGWHGYDHDICEQQLRRGLANWCLADGHLLLKHNTAGDWTPAGFDEAMARFREKWGL